MKDSTQNLSFDLRNTKHSILKYSFHLKIETLRYLRFQNSQPEAGNCFACRDL